MIIEAKLILDGTEIEMEQQSDGTFQYTPLSISNGDHSYKFQVKKKGWLWSNLIDVIDPYVKRYDPDEQLGWITIKDGKNYEEDFLWEYDYVRLPDNKELVLYELYVTDFADNGQFSGVIERLDYLEELGINAIVLMSIMEGKEYDWGYLPRHFFSLKSSYGSAYYLKLLIDKCHKRKIRVIMDCVFNHSDKLSPLALIDSTYWYHKTKHHHEDPYHWGLEFNYEYEDKELQIKPAVKFISDVVRYWFSEFHFDGFRIDDTSQRGNYDILRVCDSIGRSIRQGQPFFSQAKHVSETKDILKSNGGPIDACWSSSFYQALRDCLVLHNDKLKEIFSAKNFINYFSCHDIGKEDDDAFIRMITAAILLMTVVGIPMIWQGTEFGEARELETKQMHKKYFPMQWELLEKDRNKSLFETFKLLIKLRRSNITLQQGPIDFFYEDEKNHVLAYSRGSDLVVILNLDKQEKSKYTIGNFPQHGTWNDYLTNEQISIDEVGNLTVDFLPFDSRLYIKQK